MAVVENVTSKTKGELRISEVSASRLAEVDFNDIPFGRIFADHMLEIDCIDGQWQAGCIKPYQNIMMSPAAMVLHYGQAIFEGMKAHHDANTNDILLFRPEENAKRLNKSAARMSMPTIPVELFMTYLKELVNLDRAWVPNIEGTALYIRPFMFANDQFIGVKTSQNYKLIVFTCPVGAYYSKPVKVLIEDYYVRAVPGGTGDAKAAGNYAATLYPAKLANEKGYDQILWTDGLTHTHIEEIGTMNVFLIINGKAYTPKLDGTILPGITRDSIMQLLKDKGIEVIEKRITVKEVLAAAKDGSLQEMFGTGTAATISHIAELGYKDEHFVLPPVEGRTISNGIKETLEGIKRGTINDSYNWLVRV